MNGNEKTDSILYQVEQHSMTFMAIYSDFSGRYFMVTTHYTTTRLPTSRLCAMNIRKNDNIRLSLLLALYIGQKMHY